MICWRQRRTLIVLNLDDFVLTITSLFCMAALRVGTSSGHIITFAKSLIATWCNCKPQCRMVKIEGSQKCMPQHHTESPLSNVWRNNSCDKCFSGGHTASANCLRTSPSMHSKTSTSWFLKLHLSLADIVPPSPVHCFFKKFFKSVAAATLCPFSCPSARIPIRIAQ